MLIPDIMDISYFCFVCQTIRSPKASQDDPNSYKPVNGLYISKLKKMDSYLLKNSFRR